VPELGWKSKDDIKDAVLYQSAASPPCVKIRLFLQYHGVPFVVKKGSAGKPIKKGASYTKIPVFTASGRTVNDSYVIVKQLVQAVGDELFNEEWENKIAYNLQPAIELEAFRNKNDLIKYANKHIGLPKCIACCVAGHYSNKFKNSFQKKYPDLKPSENVGKEFREAVADKKFFGGEKPGAVDISYYGTLVAFVHAGCEAAAGHLETTGLQDWWGRMEAAMPKVF